MKIGWFQKYDTGSKVWYAGQLRTLTLRLDNVYIEEITPNGTANFPSHRVLHKVNGEEVHIGAAWLKQDSKSKAYLSLLLDDPSFAAPVSAALFENDEGSYDLKWHRPNHFKKEH